MFLLIFCSLIICVLGFLIHFTQKPKRDAVRNIPGPFAFPILGAVHLVNKLNPKTFFKTSIEFRAKYGEIMKVCALNRVMVFSADSELNEQLLPSTTLITKHRNYGMLRPWLGTGLLLSDGRKWHLRRKIITPTFHFKILQQFTEVFDQQASILVDCLAKNADGKRAFNVYPYICLATLDIIAETAMGTKINAQTNSKMEYTAAVEEMTKIIAWRFLRLHLHNELIFTILHPFKKIRQTKLLKILHNFTNNVIEERRRKLQTSPAEIKDSKLDNEDINDKPHMALLDVLLQSTIDGQPLSDEDIREEVDTFMFEGHDTTALAISYTLFLLSRHPQIQNKVLKELHQILSEKGAKPLTMQELNELKYLECIIKESLRLYPPIPLVGREITHDFKYKHSRLGDGVIPAGTEFYVAIYGKIENKADADIVYDFVPERHLAGNANENLYFIPFSAGPRNCIGQKFAMLEIKMILAKILLEYELLPLGKNLDPELNIVLRSTTGMQIGIRKRNI